MSDHTHLPCALFGLNIGVLSLCHRRGRGEGGRTVNIHCLNSLSVSAFSWWLFEDCRDSGFLWCAFFVNISIVQNECVRACVCMCAGMRACRCVGRECVEFVTFLFFIYSIQPQSLGLDFHKPGSFVARLNRPLCLGVDAVCRLIFLEYLLTLAREQCCVFLHFFSFFFWYWAMMISRPTVSVFWYMFEVLVMPQITCGRSKHFVICILYVLVTYFWKSLIKMTSVLTVVLYSFWATLALNSWNK